MTNKSKMKLKKMNFLKQHRTSRRIAPITRIDKYRIDKEVKIIKINNGIINE